jgi:hypothetical protein
MVERVEGDDGVQRLGLEVIDVKSACTKSASGTRSRARRSCSPERSTPVAS